MSPKTRLALGGCLVAAALLRFTGLSWGLAHMQGQVTRIFIDAVWQMVSARDLDQRCFLYPGLFFYLLYGPISLVHRAGPPTPSAYLAARCLVAAFGVGSVALVYALGRRIHGPRLGLLAAALLCLSPLEVEVSHDVRPDVVLEFSALVAFLAFGRVGDDLRQDVLSGLALGTATAVKFTGVLLAPSYLVARLLAPGPRLGRILVAGSVSLAVFLLFTPYAILTPERFYEGAHTQLAYHYVPRGAGLSHAGLATSYGAAVVRHLGVLGTGFLAAGLVLAWRDFRAWAPLVTFPVVSVAVYSTATVGEARFLLPAGGVFALLAARGLEGALDRSPRWGSLAVALTLLVPAVASVRFVSAILKPTPMDQARTWIEAHEPRGAQIMTGEKHLRLDTDRFNLSWFDSNFWRGDPPTWGDRLLAREADVVVADPDDPLVRDLTLAHRAEAAVALAGTTLGIYTVPPSLKPSWAPVPLAGVSLSSPENPDLLPGLVDGSRPAAWHSASWQGPRTWIQVDWPSPVLVGRVEVLDRSGIGSALGLEASPDGKTWRKVPTAEFDQAIAGRLPRQVLLLDPVAVRGLRIVPDRKYHTRWAVSELRLLAPAGETGTP